MDAATKQERLAERIVRPCRPFSFALISVLLFFAAGSACAQRLIVCTKTLSAVRESCGVYLHSVELGQPGNGELPGPVKVPGTRPAGPMLPVLYGLGAVTTSAYGGSVEHYGNLATAVSLCRTAPFEVRSHYPAGAGDGWTDIVSGVSRHPRTHRTLLVTLGKKNGRDGKKRFRIGVIPSRFNKPLPVEFDDATYNDLPGEPFGAAILPDGERAVVLCGLRTGLGAVVHVRDIVARQTLLDSSPVPCKQDRFFNIEPSAIVSSDETSTVVIVVSGHRLDEPSGDYVSRMYMLDAENLEFSTESLTLKGTTKPGNRGIEIVEGGACWIITQERGTQFGYATLVAIGSRRPEKQAQITLTGVSGDILPAAEPRGERLALAYGRQLEIWTANGNRVRSMAFDATVRDIDWTPEGLFAGEAGRVHRVDPDAGVIETTVQLQTGHVDKLLWVSRSRLPGGDLDADGLTDNEESRMGTSPRSPDTDNDGIPDGTDPEPLVPSPRLSLPDTLAFSAEAAGRELRAIVIDPAYGEQSEWRLEFEKAKLPWLVAHPLAGSELPAVVYLGIDPVQYADSGKPESARFKVAVTGTQPGTPAAGSPANVELRIRPERSDLRRVLWLCDTEQPSEKLRPDGAMDAVRRVLSGPPCYFVHESASAPFLESLGRYSVVVLDAGAALQGALTRQSLLNYVTGGGGLIILCSYMPGIEPDALSRWLNPIGIGIDTSARVEGVFEAGDKEPLLRNWNSVHIGNGCSIHCESDAIRVPLGNHRKGNVFVAYRYSYGRIALLASPTPFGAGAMEKHRSRLFAEELFHWLANAGGDVEDMDGDGLPDDIEDRNGNGVVDAGETDFLKADTDGNGIPDGIEDANRNGRVDEGETDPRNPDSDSDGINDGADAQPLPMLGAPQLLSVEPAHGPMEGGTPIVLTGRNFGPDIRVRIGTLTAFDVRRIDADRIIAKTPWHTGKPGDMVDVRVSDARAREEAVLPRAFRYTELTKLDVKLSGAHIEKEAPGVYSGRAVVTVQCERRTNLNRLMVYIVPEPNEGFRWKETSLTTKATAAGCRLETLWTDSGGLRVDLLNAPANGRIAVTTYEYEPADNAAVETVNLRIKGCHAQSETGRLLRVTKAGAVLTIP